MKKIFGIILMLFAVVSMAGNSSAWEGRMAGMGNPKGLIGDESDFLIHPAKIVSGEGVKYYLDYQFTYTDLIHWDSRLDWFGSGRHDFYHNNATSAQEYDHNSLMGASFLLSKGRMGIFFSYENKMGDFDGDSSYFRISHGKPCDFDTDSDLDNYALRLIYGLPVRNFDLGLGLGFAYRNEEQQEWYQEKDYVNGIKNNMWIWQWLDGGFFPLMIPYDSSYWELFGKAGIGKKLNGLDIDWSVRGGYILSSDSENQYEMKWEEPIGVLDYHVKQKGDVRGYRVGSDLWVRRQVNDELTLPFLVSVEYAKKDRDGNAFGTAYYDSSNFYQCEHIVRTLEIKAGGGVERAVKGCGRVGVGLYYNYLQSKDDFWLDTANGYVYDNTKYPYHQEHRLVLNLAGEQEVAPDFMVRGGVDFFYGWVVSDDYKGEMSYMNDVASLSLDGKNWGVGGSLGASKKFSCVTFEPYLKAGYREFDVDGDGIWRLFGQAGDSPSTLEKEKAEWFLGAGFSLLFGK